MSCAFTCSRSNDTILATTCVSSPTRDFTWLRHLQVKQHYYVDLAKVMFQPFLSILSRYQVDTVVTSSLRWPGNKDSFSSAHNGI